MTGVHRVQALREIMPLSVDEPTIEVRPALSGEHSVFRVETSRAPQFIDVTHTVTDLLRLNGMRNGVAVVTSQHTTASIKVNENEPELLRDMEDFLRGIVPADRYYRHNDFTVRTVNMEEDECPNAHSHCQHLLLSASESIPVLSGRLHLGKWQRIFLVELDRPRPRDVVVSFLRSS
jgi:secondary thiamine-phosphate synthase enzyme